MVRNAKPWFYARTGWWTAWIDGKRVRLVEGKKNKRAADDRLKDLQYVARNNPHSDDPQQTVASVIERYMAVVFPALADETRKTRTGYLQDFAEAHGRRQVAEARKDHVQEWVLAHPEWKSDWTKRDAVRTVQGAFIWAADAEIIPKNPFKGIRQAAGSPRRDMTPDEFRAILRTTAGFYKRRPTPGARFRQVLFMLWLTGMRPIELSKLRWKEVDFDGCVIVLRKHKTIKTQRNPKPRIIPLTPVVVRLLRFIKRTNTSEFVFLNHRGNRWNRYSLGLRLRRARVEAGVADDAKLYGVRHAFGTRGIVSGVDIKTLSLLMGHETTTMTEHYLHLAGRRDFLAASMQQVGGLRPGG
jgi:integrase